MLDCSFLGIGKFVVDERRGEERGGSEWSKVEMTSGMDLLSEYNNAGGNAD